MKQIKSLVKLTIIGSGFLAVLIIGGIVYQNVTKEVIVHEIMFEDVSAQDLTATMEIPSAPMRNHKGEAYALSLGGAGGAAKAKSRSNVRLLTGMALGAASETITMHAYGKCVRTPESNTNEFAHAEVSSWKDVATDPLSTFSIDVDRAGYSLVRRFLNDGQLPPEGAVRLEEVVNYFDYAYESPQNTNPFTVHTDLVPCPWNPKTLLARVAMQAKRMDTSKLPPSNFVFLLDVSGSMQDPDKLPLLREAMKLLVNNLRAQDKVAIVVYAGRAGLLLPSTSAQKRNVILEAIENLEAGGSTNGVGGITQAYDVALKSFIRNGNNRIIWATDGDFNVGISSTDELVNLVEQKRKQGVFLSVLGVGMGNYKDNRLEQIADKGNGNYAYLDNLMEAKKVLVREFSGSLFTVAKDVKLQIEFNPGKVKRWKQLGYENRALANSDFTNDQKDAGELGAGHAVTAFYEIEPGKAEQALRYQTAKPIEGAVQAEWMRVKARYKNPTEDVSHPLEWSLTGAPVNTEAVDESMRFAMGVLGVAKKLRKEEDAKGILWSDVIQELRKNIGDDPHGERAEFLALVHKARGLSEVVARN